MKTRYFNLAMLMISLTATQALACTGLMGGCAQEPAHDTSSHMKSQIVNKVEKQSSAITSATTSTTINTTANKQANTKHLKTKTITINKVVVSSAAQKVTKHVLN